MGMVIFEESGIFDPTYYDLKIGDFVSVIAVGGVGGGAASININGSERDITGSGGNAGECGFVNMQNASNSTCGGGGGGYGGGGGGGAGSAYPGAGGGGGYLKTATIKLASLDPIAVTVGKGGRGGYDKDHLDGEDGEASSFGSYVVAEGGGGGKAKTKSEYSLPGIGGTRGGYAEDHSNGGGGGGGGYGGKGGDYGMQGTGYGAGGASIASNDASYVGGGGGGGYGTGIGGTASTSGVNGICILTYTVKEVQIT